MKSLDIKRFIRERDEAIKSLDKNKILAYMKKYEVPIPANDLVFWAGVHKVRLGMKSILESEKEISRQWLRDNNFKTIDGSEP